MIPQQKVFFSASLALLPLILTPNALAVTFSKMYVFSDSSADSGNVFNVTTSVNQLPPELRPQPLPPILPPSPPYYNGRWSNGPVWVEYLADNLELSLTNSTELSVLFAGSNIYSPLTLDPTTGQAIVSPFFNGATATQSVNFSFAGASTGETSSGPFGDLIPGVQKQVNWLIGDLGDQQADGEALYIMSAGDNDYYFTPNADPEGVVANLKESITGLFQKGARNFLVSDLADQTEFFGDVGSLDSQTIKEHNKLLKKTLQDLNKSLNGIEIISLDFSSLFKDLYKKPTQFGLTQTTVPCLDSVTFSICEQPNEYLYWDEGHWTTDVHKIVGDLAWSELSKLQQPTPSPKKQIPEPQPLTIVGAVTALGLGILLRKRC